MYGEYGFGSREVPPSLQKKKICLQRVWTLKGSMCSFPNSIRSDYGSWKVFDSQGVLTNSLTMWKMDPVYMKCLPVTWKDFTVSKIFASLRNCVYLYVCVVGRFYIILIYNISAHRRSQNLPIVIEFEGSSFIQTHVFGLFISKFR